MATLRIQFRPSTVAGRPGSIIYRITCRNVTRYVVSGCKIYPEEWDAAQSEAMPVHAARTGTIMLINQKLRNDATRIANIIDSMSDNPALLTADGIVARFREPEAPPMFLDFMKGVIRQLREQDKVRCVETYTSTLNSFTAFRNGCDIPISEIDAMLLAEYETYLKARNVTMNTVSFYNRILRAVYNRAADKELTPQRNPFRHVYTGVGKTVKRAIPLGYIRKIKNEDLALKPSMDFARDMFMFSFYTRGMAFVDMAYLRKKDLRGGVLTYRRRKTGQRLHVKMGKVHAGDNRQISRFAHRLPPAHNHPQRQGTDAVPQRPAPCQQPAQEDCAARWPAHQPHHVRHAPLMGQHSAQPAHTPVGNKRRHGA